jgi:ABC-type multidrug transport system fused ATPase/permease subunit
LLRLLLACKLRICISDHDHGSHRLESPASRRIRKSPRQATLDELPTRTVKSRALWPSTIQRADLICVLRDGGIAEKGSHQELLQKRGLYTELVEGGVWTRLAR